MSISKDIHTSIAAVEARNAVFSWDDTNLPVLFYTAVQIKTAPAETIIEQANKSFQRARELVSKNDSV